MLQNADEQNNFLRHASFKTHRASSKIHTGYHVGRSVSVGYAFTVVNYTPGSSMKKHVCPKRHSEPDEPSIIGENSPSIIGGRVHFERNPKEGRDFAFATNCGQGREFSASTAPNRPIIYRKYLTCSNRRTRVEQ
jgi:hypothetical protein